jgi:hypothetical protein
LFVFLITCYSFTYCFDQQGHQPSGRVAIEWRSFVLLYVLGWKYFQHFF